ncbi:MAG: hypothetical protein AAGB24_11190 [Bacteroidota bacterium]
MDLTVNATVVEGYGAASGKKNDARYPSGTLAMQLPYFKDRGLDLSKFHRGTLNISIAPYRYEIRTPKHYFQKVTWTPHIPSENFYFFDAQVHFREASFYGLIYMPDPKTKTEHEQSPSTLELLLPKIDGIAYGHKVRLGVDTKQIEFKKSNP